MARVLLPEGDTNEKKHNASSLSNLCIDPLAWVCLKNDCVDDQKVMEYMVSAEQKLNFINAIYEKVRICAGGFWERTKPFKLLTEDWNLLVALLRMRGENRQLLHKIFQGIINTEQYPTSWMPKIIVNKLVKQLESFEVHHSVKEVQEILLFSTFLQEAGWFGMCELLLNKMLDKMEMVYIEDRDYERDSSVFYFGPHVYDLPQNLKNKKNVYSAKCEVELSLLKCILQQPSA